MFFGFDLKEILYFPFKDAESRKQLLIGSLVSLAAFIIPIVPYFILYGYTVQLMRQVFKNEKPHMVAWDNWGELLKDGLKLFGVRFVYGLPIMIVVLPLMITSIFLPVVTSNSSSPESDPFFLIFMGVFALTMCLVFPFALVLGLVIPAAEAHVVETGEFAASFRIKEWWAIFRANISGFLAAFGIYYLLSMALAIGIQILVATVVLSCLLPILLPVLTIYIVLIMYVTVAQAYRDGKAKLAQKSELEPVVAS